ncbi:amidohydrolase [Arthrobacter pigmenti]
MRALHHLESNPLEATTTLITGATIHTMESGPAGGPVSGTAGGTGAAPEAVLVHAGRIAAVGSVAACRDTAARLTGSGPDVVDLTGKVLVPGFIDPHAHPLMLGQMMSWVDCGPDKAADIPAVVALLLEAAAAAPAGRPVRGYGYEQRNLAEQRHPTRHELDQVATDREVYLMNASGHGGVVNTYTLKTNGITKDTPNPPGGEFFKDDDGELTGELSDAACNILTGISGVKIGHHGPNFHLEDELAEHLRQLEAAQDAFLAGGVTTIGDCQVTKREFDTYLRFADAGFLKTRVNMYLLSHLLDSALDMGLHGAFGNAMLSFAGIKFYADGTLGGWTAYFPEGYIDDPCRTGQLYHEPREYSALIRKAHAAGLQTATHAQSPTAIGMVLDAIDAAQQDRPDVDARHRIEHCGLPTVEQIGRMKQLGVYPVNQTQHYYNWGEGVKDAIGTPGERFNPLGEFVEAGVPITLSSDAPVADPNPLEAIGAAVTRITRNGHQLGPDSLRISAAEALAGHTINGARVVGRETELGSIAVGKRADFAVLDADPLAVDPSAISSIKVLQTWVDGKVVYGG